MERLAIERRSTEGTIVVSAAGEIDTSTAPSFGEALLALPDEDVVVSLEDVTYIDSGGLTVLVRAHKERTSAGFHLYVVLPRPPADRVFEITHLSEMIPCFRHLDEAIEAARPRQAPRVRRSTDCAPSPSV